MNSTSWTAYEPEQRPRRTCRLSDRPIHHSFIPTIFFCEEFKWVALNTESESEKDTHTPSRIRRNADNEQNDDDKSALRKMRNYIMSFSCLFLRRHNFVRENEWAAKIICKCKYALIRKIFRFSFGVREREFLPESSFFWLLHLVPTMLLPADAALQDKCTWAQQQAPLFIQITFYICSVRLSSSQSLSSSS